MSTQRTRRGFAAGIGISAAWGVVLFVWGRIGDLSLAREIFQNSGAIAGALGFILLSEWAPATISIGCLLVVVTMELAQRRAPTRSDWEQLEARFRSISGEVDAIWSHYPETNRVEWIVHPHPEISSERAVQRFISEARRAGEILGRAYGVERKFSYRSNDPVDEWLNCVAAMAHAGTSASGAGRNERGRHATGFLARINDASGVVCARLAASSRQ
jgi:hypothetical protein